MALKKRGKQNPIPPDNNKRTNMFGTRKVDTDPMLSYATRDKTEAPKPDGDKAGRRHQKPLGVRN